VEHGLEHEAAREKRISKKKLSINYENNNNNKQTNK
jgi:hypothetical protein